MPPVVSTHPLTPDDQQRDRERRESARQLLLARELVERMDRAADRIRRMNRLYRERLEGVRERQR